MTILDIAIDKIKSIGFDDEFVNKYKSSLQITINEVEMYVKNFCNISTIPKELYYICSEMSCGKFLLYLNTFGMLKEYVDFEKAVQQISEGDVSVSFASDATPEQQFLSILSNWSNPDPSSLLRFRKLVW